LDSLLARQSGFPPTLLELANPLNLPRRVQVIAYFRREWIATALWVVWVAAHSIRPNGAVDDCAASDLTRRRGAGQAVLTQVFMADDARINRLIP
jgi:hypothetical protein